MSNLVGVPNGILQPIIGVEPFVQLRETNAPRAVVLLDGQQYTPKDYELELNVHGSSDTATVTVPVRGFPDWTQVIYRGDDAGNADQPVRIKIYAGFPGDLSTVTSSQLMLRFSGVVDQYTINRKADTTTFTCRSLAAPLISDKITLGLPGGPGGISTTTFVQEMAAKYNLQSQILLPAGATAGTITDVLAQNFVAGIRNVSIWQLLLQCAQYDDVMLWVDETGTLWYASPAGLSRNKVSAMWGRDFADLSITHSPQFSKNVMVEVRSFQKRTKTSTTYRVESSDGTTDTPSTRLVTSAPIFGTNQSVQTSTDPSGNVTTKLSSVVGGLYTGTSAEPASYSGKERYVFNYPNKTAAQCQAIAQAAWRQISEHEFSVTMDLPMTKALFANVTTQTEFDLATGFAKADGAYWPRRISETFNPLSGGWKLVIDAVNHEYAQGQVN